MIKSYISTARMTNVAYFGVCVPVNQSWANTSFFFVMWVLTFCRFKDVNCAWELRVFLKTRRVLLLSVSSQGWSHLPAQSEMGTWSVLGCWLHILRKVDLELIQDVVVRHHDYVMLDVNLRCLIKIYTLLLMRWQSLGDPFSFFWLAQFCVAEKMRLAALSFPQLMKNKYMKSCQLKEIGFKWKYWSWSGDSAILHLWPFRLI